MKGMRNVFLPIQFILSPSFCPHTFVMYKYKNALMHMLGLIPKLRELFFGVFSFINPLV